MTDNDRLLRSRWEALLDEDQALVGELFGGRLDRDRSTWHPGYLPSGLRISVEGYLSGPSDEAGASRLLVAALEGAGLEPAGRDWYEVYVLARLHEEEERLLKWARARPLRPDALRVLYVAREPRAVPSGVAVWAATSALAERLGVPYVPPPVLPLSAGPGGDGVVVVAGPRELPGALERARSFGGRITIVPTVATPELRALAGAHELLPPIQSDLEFAALAMTADAVVCADGDPFQRRALAAASMGALPLVEGDGPVRELLGDLSRVGRAERAARVQAACGFEALAPRLRDLLDPPARALRRVA
jgi:hypothetical protein